MKTILTSLLFLALLCASLPRSVAKGTRSRKALPAFKSLSFLIVHNEHDKDERAGYFHFKPRHYRHFSYHDGIFHEGDFEGDYDKDVLPQKPGGYVHYNGEYTVTVEDTHGIYFEDKDNVRYYIVIYSHPKSYEIISSDKDADTDKDKDKDKGKGRGRGKGSDRDGHKDKDVELPDHYYILKGRRFIRRHYAVVSNKARQSNRGKKR